jgi:hypothetical protein
MTWSKCPGPSVSAKRVCESYVVPTGVDEAVRRPARTVLATSHRG